MAQPKLTDFHDDRYQDCGHVTQLRCLDCGNCYKCNHEIVHVSPGGFGEVECDDGHSKWVPPELVELIDNA